MSEQLPPMPPPAAPPPPQAPPPAAPSPPHPAPRPGAAAAPSLGGLTGGDTLIVGGAALLLIVGEIILGLLFGSTPRGGFFVGVGLTLQGVLSGEAILFVWLSRPSARTRPISVSAAQTIVLALVVAVGLYELADLIAVIKDLSGFFNAGFVTILAILCRIVGAAAMVLGASSNLLPAPAAAPRA
jgi:hypothetical protein